MPRAYPGAAETVYRPPARSPHDRRVGAPPAPRHSMKPLPPTEQTLVLRTHFAHDDAWRTVRDAIEAPVGEFRAYVEFVDDPSYAGATAEQIADCARRGPWRSFCFVVDETTLTEPEHPVLVVDLQGVAGRTFRVIPSEAWGVENNLSLANMDFDDFADAADGDGIFRGFGS